MITVYGIPNCDTVKKARAWLSERQLDHEFHDFKKRGVPAQRLAAWEQALGWHKLLNRQGTSWRKLDATTQLATRDAASAQALMLGRRACGRSGTELIFSATGGNPVTQRGRWRQPRPSNWAFHRA